MRCGRSPIRWPWRWAAPSCRRRSTARPAEARFSTLVANATDLITVLRADNTIAYQSPSIERVLGYTADEVIGRSFESLLHPEEQGRLLRRLADGAGATGRPEVIECLLQTKDGELRYFEILHSNLLDDDAVRRHRPQRPRRLRAQGVRGAARPPGLP